MSTTSAAPAAARRPAPGLDRAARLDHAERAYAGFAETVDRVRDDQWALPTDCADWTVRDLVGHVLGAMRSAASVRELVSQQREIKARAARTGEPEVDAMTAVQVRRAASASPAEVAAEVRRLVGPATRGRRRTPGLARRLVRLPVQMPGIDETWTLGYLNDVVLTRDAWMHRIDLARAIGAPVTLTADHDGVVVADVVAEWAERHGADHDLRLTGPAGLHATRGSAERIEMDAVEFCRAVSGREPAEGLLATMVPF